MLYKNLLYGNLGPETHSYILQYTQNCGMAHPILLYKNLLDGILGPEAISTVYKILKIVAWFIP